MHLRIPLRVAVLLLLSLAPPAGQTARADVVEALAQEGDRFYRDGDFEQARRVYSEALAIDGTRSEALNNRGLARARMGDLNGALADLTSAVLLRPENGAVWNNRANVNCALKRVFESVADRIQALRTGRFTAAQAQTGLRVAGFYRGPSDGIWGADSERALEDWTRAGCPRAPASRLL